MDLKNIKIGDKAPVEVNAVIEIPQGSDVKYEVNFETGLFVIDRIIGAPLVYPYNYGYIPQTLADDGDALDILVISPTVMKSGSVLSVRPIGVLKMEDENGRDEKILAISIKETDPEFIRINDLFDLNLAIREEIDLFFKHYKETERKRWSNVNLFGDKLEAYEIIDRCINKFTNKC